MPRPRVPGEGLHTHVIYIRHPRAGGNFRTVTPQASMCITRAITVEPSGAAAFKPVRLTHAIQPLNKASGVAWLYCWRVANPAIYSDTRDASLPVGVPPKSVLDLGGVAEGRRGP